MMAELEQDQLAIDQPRSKADLRSDRISKRKNPTSTHPPPPSNSAHAPPNRRTTTPSVNRLKSKIRDITRLLRRPEKLPADVLVAQERALAGYRQDLERIEGAKRRNKMISKYHMVRFFGVVWTDITFEYTPCGAPERQKATRHLKKLQKRLDTLQIDSAKYAALQEEADIAAIDLDYTLYYPLDQKYQSLYPLQPPKGETGGKPGDEDRGEIELSKRSRASKPKLWDVVAQCRETGRLEALRDGRLGDGSMKVDEEQVESGSSYNKVKKKKRKDTLREVEEEGSEEGSEKGSDGGFFEE